MRIRPCIYINGSYSSTFQLASQARRDLLAKPVGLQPSAIGPTYPMLWDARYSDNTANYTNIPVQTGSPKYTYELSSGYYGPWDDYGNTEPWSFWQYASVVRIPGFPDTGVDGNVSHGDIEYVKNYLVPAVWWNDTSGDWSTLTNWNSGQPLSTINTNDLNNPPAPYSPHWGAGQTTPFASYTLPTPRLPGAAGSGATSGQHDTVILERPSANITVTLSTGTHNIRKLYMRETLNITGGSLNVNYDPTYRADNNALVLHGGPVSAQLSGAATLSGTGALTVHTLQVDTNRIFTTAGGTLTFNKINIMPHNTLPARLAISGNPTFNPRSNVTAVIAKGAGTGTSGYVDLNGAIRTVTVGDGTNDVDVSIEIPVANGGLAKAGAGTLRVTIANSYTLGTTVSAGRLLVNNGAGSGTGTGAVTVNGGVLGGTGIIAGAVTVNGSGIISPGTSIGQLTLNTPPTLIGATLMEINRNGGASLADKIVLTSGTLNYGGTLVVTNIGAALIGGEIFTNFNAPAYSGSFANTFLPSLSAGLNWYLGHLTTNGTIKVNRSPVANGLAVTNNFPSVLQIPIANLVSNATDADADALSLSSFGVSTNGVTLTSDGTFLIYSNSVNVTDKFNFVVTDTRGGFATNTVSIAPTVTGSFTQHPNANGSSVTLHFSGTPGVTYYVDRSTNLPSPWLPIWTNVAPPSGLFDYTDNFDELSEPPPSAFYRLRW
jgi:autotransporter-associated beta strand protein